MHYYLLLFKLTTPQLLQLSHFPLLNNVFQCKEGLLLLLLLLHQLQAHPYTDLRHI